MRPLQAVRRRGTHPAAAGATGRPPTCLANSTIMRRSRVPAPRRRQAFGGHAAPAQLQGRHSVCVSRGAVAHRHCRPAGAAAALAARPAAGPACRGRGPRSTSYQPPLCAPAAESSAPPVRRPYGAPIGAEIPDQHAAAISALARASVSAASFPSRAWACRAAAPRRMPRPSGLGPPRLLPRRRARASALPARGRAPVDAARRPAHRLGRASPILGEPACGRRPPAGLVPAPRSAPPPGDPGIAPASTWHGSSCGTAAWHGESWHPATPSMGILPRARMRSIRPRQIL